jgi:hypothetical protein
MLFFYRQLFFPNLSLFLIGQQCLSLKIIELHALSLFETTALPRDHLLWLWAQRERHREGGLSHPSYILEETANLPKICCSSFSYTVYNSQFSFFSNKYNMMSCKFSFPCVDSPLHCKDQAQPCQAGLEPN